METTEKQLWYEPLPSERHIRLLHIHPGTEDDLVSVSLVPVSLDSHNGYEALSYVWGDPAITQTVICNDTLVDVTENLYFALCHFRLADRPRVLWADALCINQNDLDDKAHQVQMMHLIYKSCDRCLVWLGPNDEHSDVALEVIDDMTKIVSERLSIHPDELDAKLKITGRDPKQSIEMGFTNLPPPESTKWGSLFHFLCRPWFTRVWVIQEAYFAKQITFYCGYNALTYASLYHTADWVLNNGPRVSYIANQSMAKYMSSARFNVMRMRGSDWQEDHQELKVLLDAIKKFNATDLRDKVYALMHLPPFRREYPDIQVDYRLEDSDIFTDVARRIIQYEKGLGVFTTIDRISEAPDEGLPSWVPRWHRPDEVPNVSIMWYQFFCAGTGDGSPALATDGLQGEVLEVAGFELDVIEDVCRIEFVGRHSRTPPLQPVFHVEDPWKPYERSPESPYPVEPDIVAAYAMTLTASCRGVGGFWARRCPEDEYVAHASDFVAWLQWLRAAGEAEGSGSHYPPGLYSAERPFLNDNTEEEVLEFATRYHVMIRMYNLQRRLFRTKKGYLGLGAHGLLKGDKVCILAGGAVPFILRARSTSDGYELIGDAYVHGVMNGEAAAHHIRENGADWGNFHIH